MGKTNTLWVVLDSVFLLIFNTMFFVLGGTDHPDSVWISYGFVHCAYLSLLVVPRMLHRGKSAAVFGFALYSISAAYFVVEFVIGVTVILVAPEGYKGALLLQLLVAGIYVVFIVSNMLGNESTAQSEEERRSEIDYVKKAAAQVASVMDNVHDRETRKRLERVYDAINASPAKSHVSVSALESQILAAISNLTGGVSAVGDPQTRDQVDNLLAMVSERNRQLMIFNH